MDKLIAHAKTTRALLLALRNQGKTIEQCADRHVMNRSIATIKRWCRRFDIEFQDYKPNKKANKNAKH